MTGEVRLPIRKHELSDTAYPGVKRGIITGSGRFDVCLEEEPPQTACVLKTGF